MLQLEIEKSGQQLLGITQMKETLTKIDVSKNSNIAHLGSIVKTNIGSYFLSISAGKLTVCGTNYFAVSVSSPIGKLLLGKKEKEEVVFNGKKIIIDKIS